MKERHQFQDAFNYSLTAFQNRRPQVMADLANVIWEEPFSKFNYLNIPIQVYWPTGEIFPDELSMEEKIIIYQYLAESTILPHTGQGWVSFLELPEGQHHYQPFIKEAFEPLAEQFGEDISLFRTKGEALEGVAIKGGDAAFRIQVLPKISMQILIWGKDEEFPARANILFDNQVSCHLSTSTLYMLGIAVAQRFRNGG